MITHKLLIALAVAVGCYGQTAQYPNAIATDANLFTYPQGVYPPISLLNQMASTDTSFMVSSCGNVGTSTYTLVLINTEEIAISGCTAASGTPTMTVASSPLAGRGYDNTTAASHTPGQFVIQQLFPWQRNSDKAEIEAIESTLGANLSNISLGHGLTYDQGYSTIALACAGAGTGTLVITKAWLNIPSQSLPCNVWFVSGGSFQPATSATITFGNGFQAGSYKIFDLSNSGSAIAVSDPTTIDVIKQAWFGPSNNSTAVAEATSFLNANGGILRGLNASSVQIRGGGANGGSQYLIGSGTYEHHMWSYTDGLLPQTVNVLSIQNGNSTEPASIRVEDVNNCETMALGYGNLTGGAGAYLYEKNYAEFSGLNFGIYNCPDIDTGKLDMVFYHTGIYGGYANSVISDVFSGHDGGTYFTRQTLYSSGSPSAAPLVDFMYDGQGHTIVGNGLFSYNYPFFPYDADPLQVLASQTIYSDTGSAVLNIYRANESSGSEVQYYTGVPGSITVATPGSPAGTGYVVGDILSVTQGSAGLGQVKVATVSTGVPTSYTPFLVDGGYGTGYRTASNLVTTGGTGTGATVSIIAGSLDWAWEERGLANTGLYLFGFGDSVNAIYADPGAGAITLANSLTVGGAAITYTFPGYSASNVVCYKTGGVLGYAVVTGGAVGSCN